VPGNLRQVEVFDRVAKGEVADVVKECGGEKCFGIARRDGCGEPFVGGKTIEILDRGQEDAKRMFLASVIGGGVDEADEAELTDVSETAEGGRIDEAAHAIGQRHVDSRGNPHQSARTSPAADLRDVVNGVHSWQSG
jgi:hypothetical protein